MANRKAPWVEVATFVGKSVEATPFGVVLGPGAHGVMVAHFATYAEAEYLAGQMVTALTVMFGDGAGVAARLDEMEKRLNARIDTVRFGGERNE